MNVSVTRASNNSGPFQFPEKLIPLMIANALEGKLVSAMTAPNSPIERAVVVDDGSGPEFAKLFQRVEQLRNVRLLHHAINLGKGAALKTGINFALTNWPTTTGVITADADGQHSPADIVAVARELKRYPQALILGARRFGGPVPLRSWLRNTLTRQIFRVATEKSFTDTQTGLRGWPRSACLYKHFGDDSTLRVAA